jgi:hypothetical protein
MTRRLLVFTGLFALYTILTVAFFWPWIPHLSTSLIGPPEDNLNDFWGTYYVAVAADYTSFFFTTLVRFPEGTPLYYHSLDYPKNFATALIASFVGRDTFTLVTLHNLALLVSFPLAGAGAFYLVRHLTGSIIGALIGGFVFAFNPSHIAHTCHHIGVASIEFYPWFALAYLVALEKRSVGWLSAAVVFYALGGLSYPYHTFYLAYFVAFHTLYTAIRDRELPRGWRLFVPVSCLAGAAVVMSPVTLPMILGAFTNATVYAPRHGQDADLAAYLAFPPFHFLSFLGEGVYWRMEANDWEGTIYLGVINLAAVLWLVVGARGADRRLVTYTIAGMIVFGMVAAGVRLQVLGIPTVPMPDMVVSKLPVFANVRGASRAVVVIYLLLAVAVGHAVALAWRLKERRQAAGWGIVTLAVLIVLDFYPAHALPMTRVSCSKGLEIIRDDPDAHFGVFNLPNGRPAAYLEGNYVMSQQACHGRPIAQGIMSRDMVISLRDRLETRDFDAQRRQLIEARAKYIVINHPTTMTFRWREEDGPRERYLDLYPLVFQDQDVTILRVY